MNLLEFYIIAYNNLFCVEYQIRTLRQFCRDPHRIIILDSNCGEHLQNSREKKDICDKFGVLYMELPNELNIRADGSVILAKKLNYVYHNIIQQRKPKYFCFLDQDFFCYDYFSVIPILDEIGMYGDVMENDRYKNGKDGEGPWTLHPWLSFFRFDFIDGYPLDWMPCSGFDTGGKLWDTFIKLRGLKKKDYWIRDDLYGYYPYKKYSYPLPYHMMVYKGKEITGQIQIYNKTFFHMLNSRFLDDWENPKTNWCKGFLDAALLRAGGITAIHF